MTDTEVEQVPVKKIRFDPDTRQVLQTWAMEERITRYIQAPKEKIRCKDGEHLFEVLDGGRGLFGCTQCPYQRKVYPTTYMFIDGKLIHKVTKKPI
jgi:hypothetical protein